MQKMNWETLAGEVFDAVYLYWEELGFYENRLASLEGSAIFPI
ncbi:hypothetical protein LEP1GSC103_3939 [Leptospira borgpetersenii serovar Javanica str. UI 09931]|uniref:Uncharacterized protein n=3 Tax=Leptospira borgpetersenii TaxID=174 RepID=M3GK08_LEPBO|nr:hypothetical protein LEP1GSC128_2141 [Leptospira borgpetersenii str. 200801926]EKQ91382.1 hypothetical protein LEP1GSC101_1543 [Leptospira borgpetersenii str. UI 09149]EMG01322.1 hypothetical protein LEP1GSC123_3813 [Leptospira borgpetersenii str. 200701203]EMK11537.1 hypothetical protein LEP1GSC066_1761 [Leptospira sp. serovar Kenya str. Sh9]EMN13817.1 hypothetical protein LEP1GSC055_1389 [Leptospira borgpetersenii str. Brem 307]EMN56271.1 hypothetical protein LEP1GSC090_1934 [Leptospira b